MVYHVGDEARTLEQLSSLELVVPTRHLGELRYRVDLCQGEVTLDVSVVDEEVREHLLCYLPDLVDNLKRIGYDVCNTACRVQGGPPLAWVPPSVQGPVAVERVDVSA